MISRHVWTRPHTMWGPRQMIQIWGRGGQGGVDERGQGGSGLLQAVACVYLCTCWHGDLVRDWSGHRTSPESPPPDVQLFSQVSLLEGRREELHQG